ncbi:membrane protein [Actibacterium mucosum KCTC 23349]|uniref:Membrane protein n=1 Tax=Actibacterium mucosum KCTC 23349 TaxID=1454373 RepID=A0A037ZHM6_9RHOB|nr:hypothetical protein [Actibacterium mucosum]KAJ54305.1 membrane protein [Actibacterium mucosum KCTC 23349]
MSLMQSKLVHGAGGFILMGGWAFFANRSYALPAPLIAAVVQGVLSAVITLGLKAMIERIFQRSNGWRRFILPPLAAFAVSVTLLSVVHSLAGTPALLATIAVPLTVSTLYACFYTFTLYRHA